METAACLVSYDEEKADETLSGDGVNISFWKSVFYFRVAEGGGCERWEKGPS